MSSREKSLTKPRFNMALLLARSRIRVLRFFSFHSRSASSNCICVNADIERSSRSISNSPIITTFSPRTRNTPRYVSPYRPLSK